MNFYGYKRENGSVGTRNYVGIISTVVCANEVADNIQRQIQGTTCFMHHQGCCQTPLDIERVSNTLIGLGKNPNLASVLLVSLGCESVDLKKVEKAIAESGKRVESIVIQEIGGSAKSTARGILLAQDMVRQASELKRVQCPVSDLVLGLKCGSSDTTSGWHLTRHWG